MFGPGKPWFSPIRKGQGTVDRNETLNALHVILCGSLNAENTMSSPAEPTLVVSKNYHVIDTTGGALALDDIRDLIGSSREDMNKYYCLIWVELDTDGDGAYADALEISMSSDGAGEQMQFRLEDYGHSTLNWTGDAMVWIPCAYMLSIDTCWRTLYIEHAAWAATETHKTMVHLQVWKRPEEVLNEVIS